MGLEHFRSDYEESQQTLDSVPNNESAPDNREDGLIADDPERKPPFETIKEEKTKPESKKEHFKQLVELKPLCHPGVSSIAHHEYECAPPDHLKSLYGDVYEALNEGYPSASKHLMYLYPREHGKSEAASVVVPVWAALKNTNIRIAIISESSTLAKKKLAQCEEIISKFAPRYGRTIIENKSTRLTLSRDENHSEGTIEATGMGGSVTGGHYDLIIFDDICSWDNQRTETQRETTSERFKDYMNLGSKGESVYMVIGTRKHPEDLYSGIIKNPLWKTDVRKAIQDWSIIENKEYTLKVEHQETGDVYDVPGDKLHEVNGEFETIIDVSVDRRCEVLWEQRWPLEDLIKNMLSTQLEGDEGALVWRRENQNDANVMEGKILSLDMLHYVDELPKDESKYSWYAGIDPALESDAEKAAQNDTDYWALSVIAYDRASGTSYLKDLKRRRGITLATAVSWAKDELEKYNLGRALAEDTQAQRWFVQTAKDQGLKIEKTSSTGDKEDRIISMASQFESGKVKIVAGNKAETWESFETEWVQFPSGDHDDRLDSIEIALRNTGGTSTSRSKHDLGEVFG